MSWTVSAATEPGGKGDNEDWYGVAPGAAVVLDGLSSIGDTGCLHGTPWYVRELGTALLMKLSATTTPDPADALAAAISHTADLHRHTCNLTSTGTPSSTVALIRQVDAALQYLVLSDSSLVYESHNGVEVISDKSVSKVLQEEQQAVTRYPVGSPKHSNALKRLVQEQRKIRNTDEGYWVAAASPEAAHKAIVGYLPSSVRHCALLSDGAARLTESYGLETWEGLLRILQSDGPARVIEQVRDADAADAEGATHGRYKVSDDATAVYLQL